jgi:hypothetical protein
MPQKRPELTFSTPLLSWTSFDLSAPPRIHRASTFATHGNIWNLTWQGERLASAMFSIKARAPVTGGIWGIWGGMFSTFDCAIKEYRQQEDAWNPIFSSFMTGGCHALRSELFFVLCKMLKMG